jgi:flagellar hook-associated protein FlgK
MKLKPKKWKWKNGKTDDFHYGLIYQDLDKLDKNNDFGFLHPAEEIENIDTGKKEMSNNAMTYHQLTAPLISAIQEQQAQITALQTLVNTLQSQIKQLIS